MGSRAGGLLRWIVSHVARRRAAQLTLAVLVMFVAAVVVAVLGPWSGEQRIIFATAAGFVFFGGLVFYLAFRSWDLATRLSHDAAKAREMLASLQTALALQDQRSATSIAQNEKLDHELGLLWTEHAGVVESLRATTRRSLQTSARLDKAATTLGLLDTRASGIDHVRARVAALAHRQASLTGAQATLAGRVEAVTKNAELASVALRDIRGQQSGYVQGLGATNAQLLDVASRFEALATMLEQCRGQVAQQSVGQAALTDAVAELRAMAGALTSRNARSDAAIEAWSAKLTAATREQTALGAGVARLQVQLGDMTNLQGASISGLTEVVSRVASIEGAFEQARVSAAEQFGEVSRRAISIETLTLSVQDRLLSDIDRAVSLLNARDAAIADASAILDQRLSRVETGISIVAEQGELPLVRIGELEDRLTQVTVSNLTALDDLSAHVTSLKELARSEAGRVVELSAVLKALGDSVSGSLRALGGQTTSLEQGLQTLFRQMDASVAASGQSMGEMAGKLATLEQAFGHESARVGGLVQAVVELRQGVESAGADNVAAVGMINADIAALLQRVSTSSEAHAAHQQELTQRLDRLQASSHAEGEAAIRQLRDELSAVGRRHLEAAAAHGAGLAALEEQSRDHILSLEHVHRAIAFSQDRTEMISEQIGELQGAIESAAVSGDEVFEGLGQRIDDLKQQLADSVSTARDEREGVAGQLGALRSLVEDTTSAGNEAVQGVSRRIDDLVPKVAESVTLSRHVQEKLSAQLAELREGTGAEKRRIDDLKTELATLADRLAAAGATVETLAAAWPAQIEQLKASLPDGAKAAKAAALLDTLEKSARASEAEIDVVKKGLSELSRNFGATATSSRQVIEQLSDQFTSLREAMTGEFGRVGGLTSRLASLEGAFEGASRTSDQELARARDGLEDLSSRLSEAASSIEARLSELTSKVFAAADLAEETDRRQVLDGANWYEPNNRKLRHDHVERIEAEWTRKLSLDISRSTIGYMTTHIATLERELDGRLRASIEDTLLRTLVARSVKGARLRVLELGASFGVETAVMHDQLKDHFADVGFTILDPLDAVAHDVRSDRQTGLPVSERIVRRNLARVGLQDKQATLIKQSATDLEAVEQASAGAYDVLIIDADHSYAGVKACFENYGRMVRLGGYIIFAEYGSPEWPDVQAFVDAEVGTASHVSPVGTSWRTAVYRVVKVEKAPPARAAAPAAAKPAAARRRKK